MTPKERAEKITQILMDCKEGQMNEAVRLIMAQIAEAQREATGHCETKSHIDEPFRCAMCFIDGFSSARKQAAEIAKDWPGPGGIVECNSMEPVDVMDGLRKGLVTQIEKMDVKP